MWTTLICLGVFSVEITPFLSKLVFLWLYCPYHPRTFPIICLEHENHDFFFRRTKIFFSLHPSSIPEMNTLLCGIALFNYYSLWQHTHILHSAGFWFHILFHMGWTDMMKYAIVEWNNWLCKTTWTRSIFITRYFHPLCLCRSYSH